MRLVMSWRSDQVDEEESVLQVVNATRAKTRNWESMWHGEGMRKMIEEGQAGLEL